MPKTKVKREIYQSRQEVMEAPEELGTPYRIEVSPHFRRPHFCWRWTGEGRKIPKFVPIKGALVHRDMIEKLPTGEQGSLQED